MYTMVPNQKELRTFPESSGKRPGRMTENPKVNVKELRLVDYDERFSRQLGNGVPVTKVFNCIQ